MKTLLLLLVVVCATACSKSEEAQQAEATKQDPFIQKLNSLPESERAEYARQHAEEAMKSAGSQKAPGG